MYAFKYCFGHTKTGSLSLLPLSLKFPRGRERHRRYAPSKMTSQIRLTQGNPRPVNLPTQLTQFSVSSPFAGFNSQSQGPRGWPSQSSQSQGPSLSQISPSVLPTNARILSSSLPIVRVRPFGQRTILTQQQVSRMEVNRQVAMGRRDASRSLAASQPLPGTGPFPRFSPAQINRMQRNRQVPNIFNSVASNER